MAKPLPGDLCNDAVNRLVEVAVTAVGPEFEIA